MNNQNEEQMKSVDEIMMIACYEIVEEEMEKMSWEIDKFGFPDPERLENHKKERAFLLFLQLKNKLNKSKKSKD